MSFKRPQQHQHTGVVLSKIKFVPLLHTFSDLSFQRGLQTAMAASGLVLVTVHTFSEQRSKEKKQRVDKVHFA